MLVLSRKEGQRIWIGQSINVAVVRFTTKQVRLGIEAPRDLVIAREELIEPQELSRLAEKPEANVQVALPLTVWVLPETADRLARSAFDGRPSTRVIDLIRRDLGDSFAPAIRGKAS